MSQSYSHPSTPKPVPSSDVATPLAASETSSDYFRQAHALNTPAGWTDSSMEDAETQQRVRFTEEHTRRFAESQNRLAKSIDGTITLIRGVRDFGEKRWIILYPENDRSAPTSSSMSRQPRQGVRRAQSVAPGDHFADSDHHQPTEAATYESPSHPSLHRANTEAVAQSAPNTPMKSTHKLNESAVAEDEDSQPSTTADQNEMSVLRLDLKLGAAGNNPQTLVRSLEKSSVAKLLDGRMMSSIRQLDSLRDRISDTQSKVLVTGDLNAGKSTFVNALMRRKLMPVDQQPCTTVFCEVLDAEQVNEGREEVHLVHPGMVYDVQNDNTYSRHTLEDIENIVAEAEDANPEDAPMIKCYCHDTRSTQESLLKNGIVDIALIDAPGLNRDSLKTTALFARQEQIDVVVFVVSAENHFTLSAKEFLWNASNDKAYIFIVVNKFDQIRNKDKCKRLVLEQIKQLSPRTYEDADELVHFVDSDSVVNDLPPTPTSAEEGKVAGNDDAVTEPASPAVTFTQLEACLRDFVLQRREKSKLLPAQTYLLRLLSDIEFLASTNLGVANAELAEAQRQLELARPALAECKDAQSKMETELEGEEDEVVSEASQRAQTDLEEAVDLIGQGKPASSKVSLPPYPGFFSALEYSRDVREVFLQSLEEAVADAEQAARIATQSAVSRIKDMGESYLPSDVERSQRVFLPEAMFNKGLRRRKTGIVGLGLNGEIVHARMTDVFDVHHYISIATRAHDEEDIKAKKGKSIQKRHLEDDAALVSGMTLGVGALTVFGGKAYGAKSVFDALVNLTNFFGNATVRRWGPMVFTLAAAGGMVYTIHTLPQSIPRNIGRSMKRDLQALPRPSASSSSSRRGTTSRRQSSKQIASADDDHIDDFNSTTISPDTSSSIPVDGSSSSVILTKLPPIQTVAFADYHAERLAAEVRKVARLASWDLQSRIREALAQRQQAVERLEDQEEKSQEALVYFGHTGEQVNVLRDQVESVHIA